MPCNIILYVRFPYFHVSNSALFSTQYFSTLILYRRSLGTFYHFYIIYYCHFYDTIWPGSWFNIKCHLTSVGNPIVEIRRSSDRLIFTMGFPILVRRHLYIESGPWLQHDPYNMICNTILEIWKIEQALPPQQPSYSSLSLVRSGASILSFTGKNSPIWWGCTIFSFHLIWSVHLQAWYSTNRFIHGCLFRMAWGNMNLIFIQVSAFYKIHYKHMVSKLPIRNWWAASRYLNWVHPRVLMHVLS